MTLTLRPATRDDHAKVAAAVDEWWGGRPMSVMLPPLFLEHFASTSLIAEDDHGLAGFVVGFVSVDRGEEAYAHFVGVRPDLRGAGLGRRLHDEFAALMSRRGARLVRCITSTDNHDSVAFHTTIGFTVDGEDGGRVLMSRRIPDPVGEPGPEIMWPMPLDTVLVGDWVELRQADEADAPALLAALSDDRAWTYSTTSMPPTVDQLREWLDHMRASGVLLWIVRLRQPLGGLAAGTVVGRTSFLEVSVRDARCEIGHTAYHPAVWGTQVNPECKQVLLGYAFDELRMQRVQFKTDVRNERSRRAIARLGAQQEGVLRSYQRRRDGSLRDSVVFSITTDEWPAVRARLESRLT